MNKARYSKVVTDGNKLSLLEILKNARGCYLFSLITFYIPLIGHMTRRFLKTDEGFCHYFRFVLKNTEVSDVDPSVPHIDKAIYFTKRFLADFVDQSKSPGYFLSDFYYVPGYKFKGILYRYKHLNRAIKEYKLVKYNLEYFEVFD